MMRGNLALMPAMSRIRPACAPTNTKPSWMSTGNSTSSGPDTQAPPPPRVATHAANSRTAVAPRTTTAMRTRSKRRALRATAAETAAPAAPMTTYVSGSHCAPYASRNIVFATTPSSAATMPNTTDCATSQRTAPWPDGCA